jgi:hypothetical protein
LDPFYAAMTPDRRRKLREAARELLQDAVDHPEIFRALMRLDDEDLVTLRELAALELDE